MILGSSSPGQKARTRASAAQLDLPLSRLLSGVASAGKFADTRADQHHSKFERLSRKWAEGRNRETQNGWGQPLLPIFLPRPATTPRRPRAHRKAVGSWPTRYRIRVD